MYRYNISGCLIPFIFFLIVFFIIKELWWFIVGVILICVAIYYGNLIYQYIINKDKEKKINYTPEMGEVYKICPFCNAKVKVNDITCPVCGHALN